VNAHAEWQVVHVELKLVLHYPRTRCPPSSVKFLMVCGKAFFELVERKRFARFEVFGKGRPMSELSQAQVDR
jgi:hypothetical protein